MLSVVLWLSLLFIAYAYVGYPMLLAAISLMRRREVKRAAITPRVSFIITAYNEEQQIRGKIENTLGQQYPACGLEVIVASDGSSDRTEEIVNEYKGRGVILVKTLKRKGKEGAQQLAVERASGEILVFSDVATILELDGLAKIVRNFHDPSVGCVSSVDTLIGAGSRSNGESAYVRYEMLVRSLETRVNGLVGLSGSFFAARKEVCRPWATDLQSDFNTVLNSAGSGLRAVMDEESIGYYRNIRDDRGEFLRKTRTIVRGIAVLRKGLPFLKPFRYGMFSWQLFSHKLCRWLVPFAMIAAFAASCFLAVSSPLYVVVFAIQVGFYTIGVAGICSGLSGKTGLMKIPAFLVLTNLAILNGWYLYFKGERFVMWEPTRR